MLTSHPADVYPLVDDFGLFPADAGTPAQFRALKSFNTRRRPLEVPPRRQVVSRLAPLEGANAHLRAAWWRCKR